MLSSSRTFPLAALCLLAVGPPSALANAPPPAADSAPASEGAVSLTPSSGGAQDFGLVRAGDRRD